MAAEPEAEDEYAGRPRPGGGARGCSRCGSLSWAHDWRVAYGVTLCNSCKQDEPLIPKGKAKAVYLVTDTDLRKLGSLGKTNPHKKDWSQMRLYLESQVEAVSFAKHGGPEGLEAARARAAELRAAERAQKRTAVNERDVREAAKLQRVRQQLEAELAPRTAQPRAEQRYDADSGKLQRCYSGGATVDVEEL